MHETARATLQSLLEDGVAHLPMESAFVQRTLSRLHHCCRRNYMELTGDVDHVSDKVLFGAEHWAQATFQLLALYKNTPVEAAEQRLVVLRANRLVWLIGAVSFLNDAVSLRWGAMKQRANEVYAPTFRRCFLEWVATC